MSAARITYKASALPARLIVAAVAIMLVLGPVVFNAAAMCKRTAPQNAAPVSDSAPASAAQAASEVAPASLSARSQSDSAPHLQCVTPLVGHLANQKATTHSLSDELSGTLDLLASSALSQIFPVGSSVDAGLAAVPSSTPSLPHTLRDLSSVVLLL